MPDAIAQLEFRVTGVNKAKQEVNNFQQTVTRGMTASEKSVASSIGGMVAQYMSLAVAIRATSKVLSSGIEFNKFVENTTMSFSVMMKSAEAAKAQMKDLYDFAVNSPLTFKESASSAKQLMAYGFAAKELIPTMKSLGSVAIATGHSLDDISYIYGTLRSQGRAYSRDLMQFGMRGIPIYEELGKVLGVDASKIQKMASEGRIGFKEVEQAFQNMTTNGGRFAGIIEGYMNTLTGKLSMLSDIWQQSTGTLTEGIFSTMKTTVDELIKTLSSGDFQARIRSMGESLGRFASAVSKVFLFLLEHIDLVTAALKMWVALKAFAWLKSGIMSIIPLMNTLAEKMFAMAVSVNAVGASTGLSSAFGNLKAGASLFAMELTKIIALLASPAFLALAAVGGVVIGAVSQDKKWAADNKANKESENHMVRMTQLEKDYGNMVEKAHGSLWQYMKNILGLQKQIGDVDPANIEKIATEYDLSASSVAQVLIYQGRLTQEAWDTYRAVKATKDVQKDTFVSGEQYIKNLNFASTFEAVGIDMNDYIRDALNSKGVGDLFDDYMAGVKGAVTAAAQVASLVGEPSLNYKTARVSMNLPKMDKGVLDQMIAAGASTEQISAQSKQTLTDRVATLSKYVTDLIASDAVKRADKVINPKTGEIDQNTGLLAWLLQQLELAQTGLDGLSKKAEVFKKSWTDAEWRVKATTDMNSPSIARLDDIELEREKALYAAKEEYDGKVELAEEFARVKKNIDIYYAEQTMKEIQAMNLKTFNKMEGGNPEYFDRLKEGAAVARGNASQLFQAGETGRGMKALGVSAGATATTTLQGSEVGKMISGADPMTMLIKGAADFLMSIENVSKALNPVTTLFEAMRPLLEPLINNVMQPLVDVFEMLGEAIGQMLTPFLGLFKVVMVLVDVAMAPLVMAIQILGNAFTWVYDYAIVPFANGIIKMVNALFKLLNKIPGVHLRYIDALKKSTDMLKDWSAAASASRNALDATIAYLSKKLNDMIDSQISSLQDLYNVGAITGADYASQVAEINKNRLDPQLQLVSLADQQLDTLGGIRDRLVQLYEAQKNVETKGWTDERVVSYLKSLGIDGNIQPRDITDEVIETVKPKKKKKKSTWKEIVAGADNSDAISAAETIKSPPTANGGITHVTVNVQGSVQTENDLADYIARNIHTRKSRGLITI